MIMRLTLAITALVLCGAKVQAETVYTPGEPGAVSYEKFGLDFLEYHCLDCHDSATKKGDLSLEDIGPVNEINAALWKSIWAQVALKEMPPDGLVGVSEQSLMGLNVNRGQEIILRLRTDDLEVRA